ncbi:hypothetical protein [Archaeoglobus sp.]
MKLTKALVGRLVATFLTLILFVIPALGQHLTLNDFNVKVEGLKSYYTQNDQVYLKISVSPKSDDIAKDMSNRIYSFYNNLDAPRKMDIHIYFKNGPVYSPSTTDKSLTIDRDYTNWDEGIDEVEINVSGVVPKIDTGVKTFTAFELDIENSEPIMVNITIVNPPKIESEISLLKGNLSEIEKEINDLAKKTSVADLRERFNKVKQDLNDLEALYRNKHYEDVCKEIKSVREEIKTLESNVKRTYAEYYINTAENMLNGIDVNITKVESLIDLLRANGKNVLNYTLTLADFKAERNGINSKLNDLKNSFNNGNYDDVIENGDEILKEEKTLLVKLSAMIDDLRSSLSPTTTTQSTVQTVTTAVLPKINWKVLGLYGGITVGAIVVVALVVIGLKRYMRRRRWDELK